MGTTCFPIGFRTRSILGFSQHPLIRIFNLLSESDRGEGGFPTAPVDDGVIDGVQPKMSPFISLPGAQQKQFLLCRN